MVDIGILVIVVLSILVGFIRGATREVLGFVSWVGAFFMAIYLLPFVRFFLAPYIHSSFLIDLVGGIGVFLISLIVLSICTKFFSSQVRDSLLSGVDRSLGAIFGFGRGIIVVSLLYLTLTFFLNPVTWPDYLKEARLLTITKGLAEYIISLIPETEVPEAIKAHFSQSIGSSSVQDIMQDVKTLSILKPIQEENALSQNASAS